MFDVNVRRRLGPVLDRVASPLVRLGIPPLALTVLGLVLGLGAAVAAARTAWLTALALWLLSRLADGLDGPVARLSRRQSSFGGWADLMADFAVYGAFVVGCAIGQPDARVACLVLLAAYYVNGSTLLAYSAAASEQGLAKPDTRTFFFTRGLAEGTETIVVHALLVAFPAAMAPIAWTFAAAVGITIVQRVVLAARTLERATPATAADERDRTVVPADAPPAPVSRGR
jgi:phosphatidylserine synthase